VFWGQSDALFGGNEGVKISNFAFSSCPRVDQVAITADLSVLGRADIKALIKVDRGTAFGQFCAHPQAAAQQQIDAIRTGNNGTGKRGHRHAIWAFFLFPPGPLHRCAGDRGRNGADPNHGTLFNLHLCPNHGRGPANRSREQHQHQRLHVQLTIEGIAMVCAA
jgi:hypothetical protein